MVGKLEALTVCMLKRIHKSGTTVWQPGSAIDRVRRAAVEDLVLSQVEKPKKAPINS